MDESAAPSTLSLSTSHSPHQKHPFTSDEDARLQELVERLGDWNWPAIAQLMPGRTSRQCRERWNFYLSPTISNAPWTPEEDLLLIRLSQLVGPKWTVITKNFPKRTPNNVTNRYKQLQRRIQRLSRFNPPAALDERALLGLKEPPGHGIVVPVSADPPVAQQFDEAKAPNQWGVPRPV
jgi:hypothetical protein